MSSSSYYDARKRKYQQVSKELVQAIKTIRDENPDYGYRRITIELQKLGLKVNHKAVLRIMRTNQLLCHAYERKTRKYDSYKGSIGKIAPNLLNRRFKTDRPYQKIVTDVTELRWGNRTMEERAYFTAYIDLFNGEVLQWDISRHPTVEFVTKPLEQLIQERPDLGYRMTVHSDQGFQYQNCVYTELLKSAKAFQSMSRKATCLDNAAVESFFHILKVGTVHNHNYRTYDDLKAALTKYIEYYNNKRIKIKLAGMSPIEYRKHTDQKVA
ncbi:DNA integrase [Lactobacillus selangorensis]|uniref:DNA integrase n=2 Tax=Lactobacillus selangorensis TaxID=81857 RepID=A0A0R2FQV0_9LACO|nr:DNA integrase [Lactobacillus selangorensis]KRN28517.1 DNA integrase [Lactobacillus selangorensis]